MAEQNRKTTEQKLWRMKAEDVIDSFLDYLFADRDEDSIAKEGRSLLGIYSEHGEIPRGSGFAGFCKLAGKIDRMRLRNISDQMRKARDLVSDIEGEYLEAMCMDRFIRGRVKVAIDPFTEERIEICWNDARCADWIGISEDALRKRISRGYQMLESVLQSSKMAA